MKRPVTCQVVVVVAKAPLTLIMSAAAWFRTVLIVESDSLAGRHRAEMSDTVRNGIAKFELVLPGYGMRRQSADAALSHA
jgi:hypothetical protein